MSYKDKEKQREYNRLYKLTHKVEIAISRLAYYLEHKEKEIQDAIEYRKVHPEKHRETNKRYKINHPDRDRAIRIASKAKRRIAGALSIPYEIILELQNEYSGICPYCTNIIIEGQLDHMVPISKGGTSVKENLIWVCRDCNQKKNDKDLHEFLLELVQ